MTYICNTCKFRSGTRKNIRKHSREVHRNKGQKNVGIHKNQSEISLSYHNTNYVRKCDKK